MTFVEFFFWLCAVCVSYTCVGYPLLIALIALFKKDRRTLAPFIGSVSIVLAARNEADNIDRRLSELSGWLKASQIAGDIIVVSDGSTDATAAIARTCAASDRVRVLELADAEGKAAALTAGCEASQSDVLVFADSRQRWAPDALVRLLENFDDPRVGAVSGLLVLETAPGVLAGVGLYWRFEKWLRQKESQIQSLVSATGAISAVRRTLFCPIPKGTLVDDVYWPLRVAMQGYRVVQDPRACAFDRLPDNPLDEFARKVRTLAGIFQLLTRLPAALVPGLNPVWIQWLSHKVLRLAVPWALAGMLITSFLLGGWFFLSLFWAQVIGYAVAIVGLTKTVGRCVPLAGVAASFLVLNTAALLAFWIWITGRARMSWRKNAY
jgi:poly-beta-1,6-N-acetyl-D-glucosamine synthase